MKSLIRDRLVVWLIVACSVSSIVIYAWKFNGGLSQLHQDWGDFGSFLGGVYTPIVGLLTLLITSRQMILQEGFSDFEQLERFVSEKRGSPVLAVHFVVKRVGNIMAKLFFCRRGGNV